MTVMALAFLLSPLGCEKAHPMLSWSPPQVGDQQAVTYSLTSHFTGPDGVAHRGQASFELATEVRRVDGPRITDLVITAISDEHTVDGRPLSSMSGTYELVATAGSIELKRADREPTAAEQEFFKPWKSTMDESGLQSLIARNLTEGQRFTPTVGEANALGITSMRSESVEIVVTALDSSRVTFTISCELADVDRLGGRAQTVLQIGSNERDSTSDVTMTYAGRDVGAANIHMRSHRRRRVQ